MNHKNSHRERRRHPRINKRLHFMLRAGDFDIVTETKNLSCNGLYCEVNKEIPLMTSLGVVLALPYDDQENEFEYVECNGVVVRVEEVLSQANPSSAYNIAIYFNEIEAPDKEKIAKIFKRHQCTQIE